MRKLAAALQFPLRFETGTSLLLLFVLGNFVYGSWFYFNAGGDGSFTLWLLFAGAFAAIYTTLVLAYGFDIVDATADDESPRLLVSAITALNHQSRLAHVLKLLTFVAVISGISHDLAGHGHALASAAVLGLLLLLTPLVFATGVVSHDFFAFLNPVWLCRLALDCGRWYLGSLLAWTATVLLTLHGLAGQPLRMVIWGIPLLYCYMLACHLIGLGLLPHRQALRQSVDFKADRAALKETSDNLTGLNIALATVFEELRLGQTEAALQRLDSILDANRWRNIDHVFELVATWPFAAAWRRLGSPYLVLLLDQGQFMRALDLAGWCLRREDDFLLAHEAALSRLADQATTRQHHRIVLTLLTNFLASEPQRPAHADMLKLALEVAGQRLQDEQQHARLRARFMPE